MIQASKANIALDPSPQDAVSSVSFAPTSPRILVSSWAGTISLYEAENGTMLAESNLGTVILDATWIGDTMNSAGALDGTVLLEMVRESGMECRPLGFHKGGVRAISCIPESHIIASGGWDHRMRFWDHRSVEGTANIDAGGKVYGSSRCGPNGLVFITSNRQIRVLDVRKTNQFLYDVIPQTLSHQLRGVSASADGKQVVVGSTAGRVAVEYIEEPTKCYSFKCHRVDGTAYPVNCIAHNKKYSSFATGGGDGHVSFWDGDAKKRIARIPRYPTSVSSLDFDADVKKIAVAVSYAFEDGEKDHPPDEVVVRYIDDTFLATKQPNNGGQER